VRISNCISSDGFCKVATWYFKSSVEGKIKLNKESSDFVWLGQEDINKYNIVFKNDEGEYWIKDNQMLNSYLSSDFIRYWFGNDQERYKEKVVMKQKMIFFSCPFKKELNTDIVKNLMRELNIDSSIFYEYYRSGENS